MLEEAPEENQLEERRFTEQEMDDFECIGGQGEHKNKINNTQKEKKKKSSLM